MGKKSFDDHHSNFCLAITSRIPGCTCVVIEFLICGKMQQIMHLQIVDPCQCIGILESHVLQIKPLLYIYCSIAFEYGDSMNDQHLEVVVHDNEVLRSIEVGEVITKLFP